MVPSALLTLDSSMVRPVDESVARTVGTCVICQGELEVGEQGAHLPCHPSHVFHRECTVGMLGVWGWRARCPLCRRRLFPRLQAAALTPWARAQAELRGGVDVVDLTSGGGDPSLPPLLPPSSTTAAPPPPSSPV